MAKHDFLFIKPGWKLLMIFLSFTHPEIVSRISCSSISPPEVRLTSPQFPFLKTSALSQSSETYPEYENLSEIIESCLAMTPASSHSTHGCSPLGPMDLQMSSLFKCSLTWSFSTKSESLLLHTSPRVSGTWVSWKLVFLLRNLNILAKPRALPH